MKSKAQIKQEAVEVYFGIKKIMAEKDTDYCQSWWLNPNNFNLESGLSTPEINSRARTLVKEGYLIIDQKHTSTSTGTCYKLTDKVMEENGK